jgi:serine/threonine-protein kinase
LHNLGYYRIEEALGSGRYFDVYRAVDPVRRRTVALKVLKASLLGSGQVTPRFLDQARAASDLVHPHLAWVWEVGEADGVYYLAERCVNGPSLGRILADSGPLPWEQAILTIRQVAQALDFAHVRGWEHGGVNPHNILLSPDLGAVLTDFGLMMALQAQGQAPVGEPLYRAPELWQGQPVHPPADQYALACVLVEALSGQPLFAAPTPEEMQEKHLAGVESLQIGGENVPWYAVRAIKRALNRDPAGRYPSAGEFTEAPERIAAAAGEAPEERTRREAEANAWRQAQERLRQQAEDVTRLAALEQARREIDEQIRRVSQVQPPAEPPVPLEPITEMPLVRTRPRRRATRSQPRRLWPVWAGAVILLLALGGFWLDNRLSQGGVFPPTPTWSAVPPSATATSTHTPTATPTATATITTTLTPTATGTLTPTITNTGTPTPTSTITPTPSQTPTPTHPPNQRATEKAGSGISRTQGSP